MRTRPAVSILLVVMMSIAAMARAQDQLAWRQAEEAAQAQAKAQAAQKLALAEQVIQLREQAMGRDPLDPSFKRFWVAKLINLSLEQLEALVANGGEGDLNVVTGSFRLAPAADGTIAALGDSARDLVYTRIQPCRIVDTREAGGMLASATSRTFYAVGSAGFDGQGGLAGGCGIPTGATSVAMNVTVTAATGPGWLEAYPYGSAPLVASVINYGPTTWALANGYIQPICDPATTTCAYDFEVRAQSAGTHVVIDVMGYFMKVNKEEYQTVTQYISSSTPYTFPWLPASGSALSLTVIAPVAGRIVVRTHMHADINHTHLANTGGYWGITPPTGSCPGSHVLSIPTFMPAGHYYPTDEATCVYDAASPGSYTFYLSGSSYTSGGYLVFSTGDMTATFEPK